MLTQYFLPIDQINDDRLSVIWLLFADTNFHSWFNVRTHVNSESDLQTVFCRIVNFSVIQNTIKWKWIDAYAVAVFYINIHTIATELSTKSKYSDNNIAFLNRSYALQLHSVISNVIEVVCAPLLIQPFCKLTRVTSCNYKRYTFC